MRTAPGGGSWPSRRNRRTLAWAAVSTSTEKVERGASATLDSHSYGYWILASHRIGAFEPVVRYSFTDSDGRGIQTGDGIRSRPVVADQLFYVLGNSGTLRAYNVEISAGQFGGAPAMPGQRLNASIMNWTTDRARALDSCQLFLYLRERMGIESVWPAIMKRRSLKSSRMSLTIASGSA